MLAIDSQTNDQTHAVNDSVLGGGAVTNRDGDLGEEKVSFREKEEMLVRQDFSLEKIPPTPKNVLNVKKLSPMLISFLQ